MNEAELRTERVAVLGAGVMGSSIARVFAPHCEVTIYDSVADAAPRVAGTDIRVAATLADATEHATLIIEAVHEDLDVKLELLRQLHELNPTAVFASNTSTFVPSDLARGTQHPERLLVAHFFNPADVVPLVEVVPGPLTDPAIASRVFALLEAVGKRPVLLEREIDGFVANRLQAALVREAMALAESGVASIEDIDLVVRVGLGPRWAALGPLLVMDLGGLDVWRAVTNRLFPTLDDATAAPRILTDLVDAGSLGGKSGSGFYAHDEQTLAARRARVAAAFALGEESAG